MSATLLNGRTLSATIKTELRTDVQRYQDTHGHAPGLVIVRVEGDAASGFYSKAILKISRELGVEARLELLPEQTSAQELSDLLLRLNQDPRVHGIIVQMPLPAHLPQDLVINAIAPEKDIDGISPVSAGNLVLGLPGFQPSTAAAVIEILKRSEIELAGKHVVVLGRSNVVGKPLSLLLLQQHATVTICHSRTPDLASFTRQADVLVAAVGRARMVTAEMVRPGATVIDVGINSLPEGGMVGDVDFASVQDVAGALTPVPGGVGPLTNVLLLRQCIEAAWRQAGPEAHHA
ncbi:bifunctional 5,10-methylene-tetrahydrofolate dehydrogenase/5,10-methylene-tetrahydrofolate cyclohydrolase [Dictyobacter vulcani]|uniref:Bifunctional protein FolD n=1 Tax=Dictyobacter vulcani TaxID=2607529 RepID=A0A5J4KWB9_9CHLR|nr:bifunctional 5,10-methylenetetrahydrofolate dehydrogenase/5,10-methenyltetrahydrofolate cyclohydrolase [Dictyobacter vulcani]GER91442.1 bifunctional 5,10-methylene-tetrahydrofolate dehydrogenase/5,10-methylene-tetrahydrofolate cyclohydrolase [Dictyobacter vulcani]